MITIAYVLTAVVVVLALAWILITVLRKPREIGELLNEVETALAVRLYPFVELRDTASCWDDDELWKAIGGIRGILVMHRISGVLVTLSIAIGKKYPEDAKEEAEEILWSAVYLRITTWICLLEVLAKRFIPRLPRIQARSCARLYCDIAASLEIVISICEPA